MDTAKSTCPGFELLEGKENGRVLKAFQKTTHIFHERYDHEFSNGQSVEVFWQDPILLHLG